MTTVTILGSGTSTGVPVPACHCKVCGSTSPFDNRMRASALITDDGRNILIDCGPDFRSQALREGIERIDALLITHSHYDHVGGLDDLRPFCALLPDHRMPIYCTADVAGDLRARLDYCFNPHPYPGVPQFDIHVIDREPFMIGGMEIRPIPLLHGKKEIRGFQSGNFAYITDCSYLPESSKEYLKDLTTLVINALRFKPHHSHFNLEQALAVVKELDPGRTFLTHLSHDIGLHKDLLRLLPKGVYPAFDGLTFRIDS